MLDSESLRPPSFEVPIPADQPMCIFSENETCGLPQSYSQIEEQLYAAKRTIDEQATVIAGLRELLRLADTDPVTGLHNRMWYERIAIDFLKRYTDPNSDIPMRRVDDPEKITEGTPVFLMMDLDNFKTVNDKLGHSAGDRVLYTVAQTLQDNMRTTDLLWRHGGDELGAVIMLPENASDETVALIIQLFKERVETVVREDTSDLEDPDGNKIIFGGFSLGYVRVREGMPVKEVVELADKRLYDNKLYRKGISDFCEETECFEVTTPQTA
jgi:diguanylate cyclase (GGDEF)-like protein